MNFIRCYFIILDSEYAIFGYYNIIINGFYYIN